MNAYIHYSKLCIGLVYIAVLIVELIRYINPSPCNYGALSNKIAALAEHDQCYVDSQNLIVHFMVSSFDMSVEIKSC